MLRITAELPKTVGTISTDIVYDNVTQGFGDDPSLAHGKLGWLAKSPKSNAFSSLAQLKPRSDGITIGLSEGDRTFGARRPRGRDRPTRSSASRPIGDGA